MPTTERFSPKLGSVMISEYKKLRNEKKPGEIKKGNFKENTNMIPLIWVSKIVTLVDTENIMMVARGWEEGKVGVAQCYKVSYTR